MQRIVSDKTTTTSSFVKCCLGISAWNAFAKNTTPKKLLYSGSVKLPRYVI